MIPFLFLLLPLDSGFLFIVPATRAFVPVVAPKRSHPVPRRTDPIAGGAAKQLPTNETNRQTRVTWIATFTVNFKASQSMNGDFFRFARLVITPRLPQDCPGSVWRRPRAAGETFNLRRMIIPFRAIDSLTTCPWRAVTGLNGHDAVDWGPVRIRNELKFVHIHSIARQVGFCY